MLKCSVVGNVGSDPEIKYSQDGKPILRFSVASNGRVRNQAGEWQDETTWVRVLVFGQRAETLSQHLHKGMRVFVDGRLEARPWTNNAGNPQAGLEVIAGDVEFVSSRQDGPGAPVEAGNARGPADDAALPF